MSVEMLNLADYRLAYQQVRPAPGSRKTAGVVFLSGFASDRTGSKASFLHDWCQQRDVAYLRFDYRGCGASDGVFADQTIGNWLQDSLAMLDQATEGPQILVGSSMGGWMALLLALARPQRVKEVIGLAAAPDFTENLLWDRLSAEERKKTKETGVVDQSGFPLVEQSKIPITYRLIEEGRRHLVLKKPMVLQAPVHLIQGQRDEEVPWTYPFRIAEAATGAPVRITLLRDAGHRLSRDTDLALIARELGASLGLK